MFRTFGITISLILLFQLVSAAQADLVPGLLSDFQDSTVQGWDGGTVTNVPNVGPLGSGDHSLQLSNGGTAGFFAMFNLSINGVISPTVNSISTNIWRPSGVGSANIRLVLFDTTSSRWTSTTAVNVVDDGAWHQYNFSIQESALTRVVGAGTYTNLTTNLERIMFRFDDGAPSSGGAALNSFMYFDNITAVPEPTALVVWSGLMLGCVLRRRR